MEAMSKRSCFSILVCVVVHLFVAVYAPTPARAQSSRIRIMPTDGAELAVGQRFDLRVEATGPDNGPPPRGLRVTLDGTDVTDANILDEGVGGERGAGGTGASGPGRRRAGRAPANSTNLLIRDLSFSEAGVHMISARTADGAAARVEIRVHRREADVDDTPRVRNVILLLGDGMGTAHRTAARLVSRGLRSGKAAGRLAMDTMEATGLVMTASLNAVITDSAPGMSSYVTGQKGANNQIGVYPDNTADVFDNPRVEYLGEMLRRTRGARFNVGLVTTADVTDATPAGNAVHTSDRSAGPGIAAHYFDERDTNGIAVLMGGGARHFSPNGEGDDERADGRDLVGEYRDAGYRLVTTGTELGTIQAEAEPPARLLGLFHPAHMNVSFDKVGAGRYSRELALEENASRRDQPMLDDMARAAIRSLAAHSSDGFYLLIEGASIDKQAHAVDAERTIWDVIELDRAVQVALDFAETTNNDADPTNDTLVLATADHEAGGLAIIGVGNEPYAPAALGTAVRDYAAVFRFEREQLLDFTLNYDVDEQGYPRDPDPSRKLIIGWAAAPDHYENWTSNRLAQEPAVARPEPSGDTERPTAIANPERDGPAQNSDNETMTGRTIPGFLVKGTIENGAHSCKPADQCQGDIPSEPHTISGHTATDVPLSASGPGALRFTGTYENTDVFFKLLRVLAGE
ncbi:MAG: alkaline phosphatase [Luteitalea sp.]|nr:alkaline phosphatase [Luteitalea sp.]